MRAILYIAGILGLAGFSTAAWAKDICTLIADPASRTVLLSQGDCQTRVTPASTFKVALAVMAYDAGFITSPHDPKLPFKEGYADWGGAAWRQDTDPLMWMTNSTVWFSQRLTEQLGAETLTAYATQLGYGNADFSGDPDQNNGLKRAWISSSLKISPLEQAGFLAGLIEGKLPVSAEAMDGAIGLVQQGGTADGWTLWGKTGSAYPRLGDGTLDRAHGWGWYVGWAEKAGRRVVFVRLAQDEERQPVSAGLRARDDLIADWPDLVRPLAL
ncbi:beta-lactamase [Devosia soli]|uniref:beta-lactamase n=1 Tax=Devosia soli TaxID=361041 RepID=A0A0F5L647_9HYPH|nr:class D beta-lactamase [Devosia soli]KKB77710.1 beta-lactamase [Devosia soli]